MSKALEKLRQDERVETVEDERKEGLAIFVTLTPDWTLNRRNRHARVFFGDTIKECRAILARAVKVDTSLQK